MALLSHLSCTKHIYRELGIALASWLSYLVGWHFLDNDVLVNPVHGKHTQSTSVARATKWLSSSDSTQGHHAALVPLLMHLKRLFKGTETSQTHVSLCMAAVFFS